MKAAIAQFQVLPPYRIWGLDPKAGFIPLRFVDPSLRTLNRDVPKVRGLREVRILFEPPGYKPIILWLFTKKDFRGEDLALLRRDRPVAAWWIPEIFGFPSEYQVNGRRVRRTRWINLDNPEWFQEWMEWIMLAKKKLVI